MVHGQGVRDKDGVGGDGLGGVGVGGDGVGGDGVGGVGVGGDGVGGDCCNAGSGNVDVDDDMRAADDYEYW